jgi:RHS repeat-associated protein
MGVEPLEDRLVPVTPPMVDYLVNNNALGSVVTLIGLNGATATGVATALDGNGNAVATFQPPEPVWIIGGYYAWTAEVVLPNGWKLYNPNNPGGARWTGNAGDPITDAQTLTVVVRPNAEAPNPDCYPELLVSADGNAPELPVAAGEEGVRRYDGRAVHRERDIESSGVGLPWGQFRAWANTLGGANAAGHKNGQGWTNAHTPTLRQTDASTVSVTKDGLRATTFRYISGAWKATNSDQHKLAKAGGEWTLTDETGNTFTFYDDSVTTPLGRVGRLKQYTGRNGQVVTVTAYTGAGDIAEVRIQSGATVDVWEYAYAGVVHAAAPQLASVTQRRSTDGGVTSSAVRSVEYRYYAAGEAYGNAHDLKAAIVHDGDLASPIIRTSYYRYYKPGEANGYAGGLKYVLLDDGFNRAATAYGVTIDTAHTLTDAQLAVYANNYLEYRPLANEFDNVPKVAKEVVQGAGCSTCGGAQGKGTYTFEYLTRGNQYGTINGDQWDANSWFRRTTVTKPDGNKEVTWSNARGQAMLHEVREYAAGSPTGRNWRTYNRYDAQGRLLWTADAVAVTGYDETKGDLVNLVSNNAQYVSDTAGKVLVYAYGTATTATTTTPGDVLGYTKTTALKHGELDPTAGLLSHQTYIARTANGATVYEVASTSAYPVDDTTNVNDASRRTTTFGYQWFTGASGLFPQAVTVTLPVVATAQNGSGVATSAVTVFDTLGRVVWEKDAAGFLTHTAYDLATGAVVKYIEDVNTALTADFADLPAGWATPAGGGLHLKSTYEVDRFGRAVTAVAPNGRVDYQRYNDVTQEVRTYPGWAGVMTTGPVIVSRIDRRGGTVTVGADTFAYSYAEQLTMSPTWIDMDGLGRPTGTEAVSNVQSLSRQYQNQSGQTVWSDAYHAVSGLTYYAGGLPAFALGASGTNFDRTVIGYDNRGRQNRVTTPAGTLTRTDFDVLGRPVATWVGTTDGVGGNMTQTGAYEYDGGGAGNGNLTKATLKPGGGQPDRVTANVYDWRDRVVATKAGVEATEAEDVNRPITTFEYNNLGELWLVETYDGDTVTPAATNGVFNGLPSARRRARVITSFDALGRAWRTDVYSVEPTSGAVSTNTLQTNTWFDARGLVAKTAAPGVLVEKTVYDGAGRVAKAYTTDGGGDAGYADALTVTGDVVLAQAEFAYDGNGNLLSAVVRERFHDAAGTGELGTPTTGVPARVSNTGYWYDLVDRLRSVADVGTNGGTAWTRPTGVPVRSDTVLVSTTDYDDAGRATLTTDPHGVMTRFEYDALGRVTKSVENFVNGTVSDTDDKTTEYAYGPAGRKTLTVKLTGGGGQTTEWVYGVSPGTGSGVTSNDVVSATRWPDPTTGAASTGEQDVVTVNALGEVVTRTDRNGNQHAYTYDIVGRLTDDAVTLLGANVDGAVRRVSTKYDEQGNAYLRTSYDAAAGGSVVNQVQRAFNGLGQLVTEWQAHAGAVDTGTTPKVQYAYTFDPGVGGNHSRLTSVVYPNGRTIAYSYGTAGGLNDRIGRLEAIQDGGTTLEGYQYLGLDTVIVRSHPQPGLDLTFLKQGAESTGDAGDQYSGLNRFGRVVDQRWRRTSDGSHADRFAYTYDRVGSRVEMESLVNPAFEETYTYDGLYQLSVFGRSGVAPRTQSWDYDAAGNVEGVTTDAVTQARTHNRQNEVTAVGGLTAPAFDANGNLTTDEADRRFVYDGWDRLVAVKTAGGATVATFAYDADGQRVLDVIGGTTTDLYYSADYQVIEERVGGAARASYVWSAVYVDALVARDRDADANGSLEERIYAVTDANFNVTALVDTAGVVLERFTYDPFGRFDVWTPAWVAKPGGSDVGWAYLHQGLRYVGVVGQYDNRARWYSPTLMRFTTADSWGYAAGDVNLYRYVGNGPSNATDPSGHIAPVVAAALGYVGRVAAGAAVGVGVNGLINLYCGREFFYNWDVAAVEGAAMMAVPGFGSGARAQTAHMAVSGAVGEGAASAYGQYSRTGHVDWNKVGEAAAYGAVGGVAFGWAGRGVAAGVRAVGGAVGRGLGKAVHKALAPFPKTHAAVTNAAKRLGVNICFAAGTPLLTPDGSKMIEDFRAGDMVVSRDEHDAAGPVESKTVEEVFVREGLVWHVHVGGQVIRTTAEHPFFVEVRGWTPANRLQVGDRLVTADGHAIVIEDLLDTGEWDTVYNLRVSDHHTYFVGSKDWGWAVWAHNAECVLYHGSRDGIAGKQFSLEDVAKRPTHLTSADPAVYLTDDLKRAAQQYATPKGEVGRAVIPDELAQAMKQTDMYGNIEYVARTQAHIEALNRHLQVKSTAQALKEWLYGMG